MWLHREEVDNEPLFDRTNEANRAISKQLNLSEHTVRNYLFRIFNKLGTSNRLELALYRLHRSDGASTSREAPSA